ncbi:pre-mRNA-splicing factor ISY1 [Magnaporthiopsis poae ATCC 64411]|uniref:Pre-mRNA-splicing factor ISY1 n=1 Tax=Magnaporthiopsis poae (strain ATCC 64411 / 73-15) TaxID=644358 RepID=A0A0C4DQP5_MAGP6|nr:pre-mRNA-splicing factor ISY1 [Magnaporthiopsis poae ATCC 64411]
MREKHAWEVHIRNLGGPNYTTRAGAGKVYDEATGREIVGAGRGYRYFGRAKELPGVKELFEAAAAKSAAGKKSGKDGDKPLEERDDLRRQGVDAIYFGYGPDEEDDELREYELAKEKEAFENLAAGAAGGGKKGGGDQAAPPGWEPLPGDAGDGNAWELPTVEEVQKELIDRRKQRLLDQLR